MRRGLFFLYKLIGVFFVLAALGKTLDSGQIIAVFTFLKIPDVLHSALVMGLILFELTLGVMMIFQLGYRWVLPLSAVVLVFFIFVLGYLFFSPLAHRIQQKALSLCTSRPQTVFIEVFFIGTPSPLDI